MTRLWAALVAAMAFAGLARADDVADFYKGKQVRLIVASGPGGGYDTYSRVLARYMPAHVPGTPGFVVQNMDGAGGLKATNYMYAVAPKDGLKAGDFGSITRADGKKQTTYKGLPLYYFAGDKLNNATLALSRQQEFQADEVSARIAGAAKIFAIDVVPERLALARELGATQAIDGSREDALAAILAGSLGYHTGDRRAIASLEAAGQAQDRLFGYLGSLFSGAKELKLHDELFSQLSYGLPQALTAYVRAGPSHMIDS